MIKHQLLKKESLLERKYLRENHETPATPVFLTGYMLFNDVTANKHFVLLDFINHCKEAIEKINFEVIEFDEKKQMINKRIYWYDTVILKGETRFKMINKFEVHKSCKEIKVNIIEIIKLSRPKVDRVVLNKVREDTEIKDLTYSFEIIKKSKMRNPFSFGLGMVFITLFVILLYAYRYILTHL